MPVAKPFVNDLSFLYCAVPNIDLSDSIVCFPCSRLLGVGFAAVDDGGGNCITLFIGGGFFGANAVATFALLLLAVGGAGKSDELDSAG